MFAVECCDLLIARHKTIKRKDERATLESLRDLLDGLADYARQANPATYGRALELCDAHYQGLQRRIADGVGLGPTSTTDGPEAPGMTS